MAESPRLAIPRARLRHRRLASAIGWSAAGGAFGLLVLAMLHILGLTFLRGLAALGPKILSRDTEGMGGGLRNAVVGTLVLSGGALLLTAPLGMAVGVYLSEFGRGRFAAAVRFLSDVLVGVPSIVLGYFGYIALVIGLGWRFSLAAGAVTLAILMLPYVVRTTEQALRRVPNALREAAYALGGNDRQVVFRILLRAAAPGILTGLLLALTLATGETAPLLYTAGWSNYLWSGRLTHQPVAYLTYVIWSFIGEPFRSAHRLAYAAAFLIVAFILLINVGARFLLARVFGPDR
jgi:phosphate transport system permease protein